MVYITIFAVSLLAGGLAGWLLGRRAGGGLPGSLSDAEIDAITG